MWPLGPMAPAGVAFANAAPTTVAQGVYGPWPLTRWTALA